MNRSPVRPIAFLLAAAVAGGTFFGVDVLATRQYAQGAHPLVATRMAAPALPGRIDLRRTVG